MIYFTADLHLDHNNVIKYCDRPFKNVKEMNEALITNWNNIVTDEDTIYILGDFCFGGSNRIKELIPQFNGRKIFIRGNHDTRILSEIESLTLKHNSYRYYLIHDPVNAIRSMITFCGHVHRMFKLLNDKRGCPIINVGVDVWDYKPVSLDELNSVIK